MTGGFSVLNVIIAILTTVLSGFLLNRIEEIFRAKRKDKAAPKEVGTGERLKNYLFSIGYVFFFLTILILLEFRWPLSNLSAFFLFVGLFVTALILFVGKEYLLSKEATRKRRKERERLFGKILANPIVLEAGTLIILLLTIFFFDRFLPHDISLNNPRNVGDTTLISGRVIDESWTVYVLIRPIDSSGTFVEKATGPDGDKNWNAICYFGGGSGKQFYIRAVALSEDKMKELGNSSGAEEIEKKASIQSRMYLVTKKQ